MTTSCTRSTFRARWRSTGELSRRIEAALESGVRWLILDLSEAVGITDLVLEGLVDAAGALRARKGELIVAGVQRHVAQRLASYDVAHRPAVAANVDQAVMILKMLRPKTDIRRAKKRVTSSTLAAYRTDLGAVYPGRGACRLDNRSARPIRRRRHRQDGLDRRLPADGRGERLPPDPVRGNDALRRLQRQPRASTPCWSCSAVGVAANVVGSWIAYGVGYFGRVDLIEKHGRKVFIKPHHLKWADNWFEKYGDATVFFSRMLPIIRTFISLPAGVARMPFCASPS